MFGSNPFKSVRRRISRSLSRAGEILTGVGPTPTKLFKNAIIDGDEEKAITIYTCGGDGEDAIVSGRGLRDELAPSQLFPSKKNQTGTETPLHLSAKYALIKLLVMLLDMGGDPSALNLHRQTCLHSVCSASSHPEMRATIVELLLRWRGGVSKKERDQSDEALAPNDDDTTANIAESSVSLNQVDAVGNAAIHHAAENGLLQCIEKLVSAGAIISLVNGHNLTCCELADEKGHRDLAHMLELALVFQPVDDALAEFDGVDVFPYANQPSQLLLESMQLNDSAVSDLMSVLVTRAARSLEVAINDATEGDIDEKEFERVPTRFSNQMLSRAEVLLSTYGWNLSALQEDLGENVAEVLSGALIGANLRLVAKSENNLNNEKVSVATAIKNNDAAVNDNAATAEAGLDSDVASPERTEIGNDGDLEVASKEVKTLDVLVSTEDVDVAVDDGDLLAPAPVEASTTIDTSTAINEKPEGPAESDEDTILELPCAICGDTILREVDNPALFVEAFSGIDPCPLKGDPGRRQLSCGSGHSFCVDCWSGHACVQVQENGAGTLRCPGYKCGEVIHQHWAPVILHQRPELIDRLKSQQLTMMIDCCSALRRCPVQDCGLILGLPMLEDKGSRVGAKVDNKSPAQNSMLPQAALCGRGHIFCLTCLQPAHSPCPCEQRTKWLQQVQEEVGSIAGKGSKGSVNMGDTDDLANALWVAANTKRCPRCSTAIEKDEGCNHMTCKKCRKDFCWICMQDWSLHSDSTGGYFQCNRFVQQNLQESGGNDLLNGEAGNAHAETLRSREKNRAMGRFIHHFTRYQAHLESVQLEMQMMNTTLKRISDGLHASLPIDDRQTGAGPQLTWLQFGLVPNPLSAKKSVVDSADVGNSMQDVLSAHAVCDEDLSLHELRFLRDGFEELIKCRTLLQWSYPYAFFEFEKHDDHDYTGFRPPNLARRSRYYGRDYVHNHRTSFELLQGDLEGFIETLSDVVARRRLRAGHGQIRLATRAARSKRLELEQLMHAFAVTKQEQPQSRTRKSGSRTGSVANRNRGGDDDWRSTAQAMLEFAALQGAGGGRSQGYHRTRNNPGGVRGNTHRFNQQLPDIPRSDSEDSIDLAELIYQLEIANSAQGFDAATSVPGGDIAASFNGDDTSANEAAAGDRDQERMSHESLAASVDQAPEGNAEEGNPNAAITTTTTNLSDMLTAVQDREQRLQLLRERMRAIFSFTGAPPRPNTGDAVREEPVTPLLHEVENHARAERDDEQASADANNYSTTMRRTISLRAVRNATAPAAFSIDSDFEIEDSDDDDSVMAQPVVRAPNRHEQTSLPAESTNNYRNENASSSNIHTAGRNSGSVALQRNLDRNPRSDDQRQQRITRLTQRAEEEAALNRAILLSLQESDVLNSGGNARTSGEDAAGADSAAGDEEGVLSESDVELLQGMGFSRDDSIQALRESRMNVQLAANRLLGTDF